MTARGIGGGDIVLPPKMDLALDGRSIDNIQLGQAIAVDWTEADYFSDRSCLSRSALALLGDGPKADPKAFFDWWSGVESSEEPTQELRFGTATHLALLQPQEWSRRVGVPKVPKPPGAKKTGDAEAKRLWAAWQSMVAMRERAMSTIPDRLDISAVEHDQVLALARNIWGHPDAAALLSAPGPVEQTLLWREPQTGVLCKVRLDKYSMITRAHAYGTSVEVGHAVTDLKSTNDHRPKPFFFSVEKFGYLEQAAFYSDAVEAWVGETPRFYFIAARSKNQPRTSVYRPSDEQLQRGRSRYLAQLLDFVSRQESGDWRAPCERGVQPLWDRDW